MDMKKRGYLQGLLLALFFGSCPGIAGASGTVEPIRYGNFNNWVTRNLKESAIIGGHEKTVYEIGPTATINGNKAYVPAGNSPWATSNVYAHVSGVTKTSNAVYPFDRGSGNKCARLTTKIETVKVLGIINMDVMVAGSVFLGRMYEPITSTSNPYSKMDMGIPYTSRPTAMVMDYKVEMPKGANSRVRSTGFSSKKEIPGHDEAMVFVLLQKRWETADGKIYAKRVATGAERYGKSVDWTTGHRVPLKYGDASAQYGKDATVGLRRGDNAYYALNSKGKLVPVEEVGWASADETPTHMIMMLSAGSAEPYVGTEGLTLYVDNVGMEL